MYPELSATTWSIDMSNVHLLHTVNARAVGFQSAFGLGRVAAGGSLVGGLFLLANGKDLFFPEACVVGSACCSCYGRTIPALTATPTSDSSIASQTDDETRRLCKRGVGTQSYPTLRRQGLQVPLTSSKTFVPLATLFFHCCFPRPYSPGPSFHFFHSPGPHLSQLPPDDITTAFCACAHSLKAVSRALCMGASRFHICTYIYI